MQLVQFSRRIWEGTKYVHTEQYAARQQVSSRKTQKLRSLPRATAWGNDRDADSYHHHPTDADEIKAKLAKERGIEDRFIFKLKDDPRVTKIGHFIRKTSLDEFPQFFNVFKGDMSLVGPRPPLPEEVARYDMLYSTRLLVKPGITGPWQISGRSDLTQEQSEYADVSYIQDWSITGDIVILLKTVVAVFKGTGSY